MESRQTEILNQGLNDYYQPAEWALHQSCWLAWPSHSDLWQENLVPAQKEFIALCEAIVDLDPLTKKPRGEAIDLLVPFDAAFLEAKEALKHLPITYHHIAFGDIWLRDTAPIFLSGIEGTRASVRFQFNGWGGKFDFPYDKEVAANIANASGIKSFSAEWVLEGGSIDVDGQGTALTSRQCLLNTNRNVQLSQRNIEERLRAALGIKKVLWLNDGLINDHTDGHIDTIARFCGPGAVVIMKAVSSDDPNREILEKIEEDLTQMTDVNNQALTIHKVPSPGAIRDETGRLMPASYLNFYISNTCVIVPTYGSPQDNPAVEAIARCFPGRKTIGLSARAILSGGGAFHCISQQVPK
jgi:agmatine deiminase